MNLMELKQYLIKVKITSLSSLVVCFNADPDVLREMLKLWMRKGCVRQCLKTPACGTSCGKCSSMTTEIYEWVGA